MTSSRFKKIVHNNGQRIWIISDTHFGHKNIIKYCNRPFSSVSDMNDFMVYAWNYFVDKDDLVMHLGDFAFGGNKFVDTILSSLNGYKVLVTGNHDGNSYNSPYWNDVKDTAEFHYNGRMFVLNHYPVHDWNNCGNGSIHLHGHTHGKKTNYTQRIDVGVDAEFNRQRYCPVLLDELLDTYIPTLESLTFDYGHVS